MEEKGSGLFGFKFYLYSRFSTLCFSFFTLHALLLFLAQEIQGFLHLSNHSFRGLNTMNRISSAYPQAAADTLPGRVLLHARQRPGAVALRYKRLGIWQVLAWDALAQEVGVLAAALAADGFQAGDRLALLGHPRAEALLLALAALWLGGEVAPLAVDLAPDALALTLTELAPQVVFAEDQEQVDRLLESGVALRRVVYGDARGLLHYQEPALQALEDWQRGYQTAALPPIQAQPEGVAFVYARSCAWDARPAGALTHARLLASGAALGAALGLHDDEEAFWGRRLAPAGLLRHLLAPWLVQGFRLSIPESLESRDQDRREIGPTLVLGSAQSYARLQARILGRLPSASAWQGRLIRAALEGQRGVLAWLVLHSLREVVGLARVRHAVLVGEAPAPDVQEFYTRLGLPLRLAEGLESAPLELAEDALGRRLAVWVAP